MKTFCFNRNMNKTKIIFIEYFSVFQKVNIYSITEKFTFL